LSSSKYDSCDRPKELLQLEKEARAAVRAANQSKAQRARVVGTEGTIEARAAHESNLQQSRPQIFGESPVILTRSTKAKRDFRLIGAASPQDDGFEDGRQERDISFLSGQGVSIAQVDAIIASNLKPANNDGAQTAKQSRLDKLSGD
jgi:hypothetical protein